MPKNVSEVDDVLQDLLTKGFDVNRFKILYSLLQMTPIDIRTAFNDSSNSYFHGRFTSAYKLIVNSASSSRRL